jgi:hypothetical protein
MEGFRLPWQRKSSPASPPAVPFEAPETTLGLQILHEPTTSSDSANRPINIIFVHRLGGSATGTWTDSQSGSFWPLWLPEVKDLKDTRILTLGYDSAWNKIWKPNNVLDTSDFAKQLMHKLWIHYTDYGNVDAH